MADAATKTRSDDEKEPSFPVSQLISESRALLGVSRHVAVGAFYDLKETSELTREDAKKRIDKFLGRPAAAQEPKS